MYIGSSRHPMEDRLPFPETKSPYEMYGRILPLRIIPRSSSLDHDDARSN